MTPNEQIECLLEYVQDIPKESWRYNAVWQEIKKLTLVVNGSLKKSTLSEKDIERNKMVRESFYLAKASKYPSDYIKLLSAKHNEAIAKKPALSNT